MPKKKNKKIAGKSKKKVPAKKKTLIRATNTSVRKGRINIWLRRVAYLLVVACFGLFGYNIFLNPVVFESKNYTIVQGASVSSVADDLDQGFLFKLVVRVLGNKVMAGTYDIPENSAVWDIAKMTTRGLVASTVVVVPEGLTVQQIVKLLNGNIFLAGKACGDEKLPASTEDIKDCPKDGELFPDTYVVAKGTSRKAVMDLMKKKMLDVRGLCDKSLVVFPSPLKNWNEVIALASIVQKETSKISEMPMVASVYLNRLRSRMRLQADPTVVYVITNGLGDMQERKLYSKHLQVKSPFNTYKNYGLPPSPIANVGLDAIRAVLHPADTNYYYFVADGAGGHIFSETLQQHNQYRSVWQAIKNGKKH